jgi:hypothetical protein
MPTHPLHPCPFCGHPRPCLRARRTGPVTTRRVAGCRVRDLGPTLGYEVACAPCGAVLFRPWAPPANKASVRRAVAALWNARAPQCPAPDGFGPCPLCGWPRPILCATWVSCAGKRYLADTIRCAECGLTVTPGWHDYAGNGDRDEADLRQAWNTRQAAADWWLLQECAPIEPLRAVLDDRYFFPEDDWKH